MRQREKKAVFRCKECEHLKRVKSLFEDIEILECSKGVHDTINIVAVGGGVLAGLRHDGVR